MARFPGRPRTRRGLFAMLGGGIALIAIAGFLLIYFVLFPTSSPKPFSLTDTTSSAASTGTGTTSTTATTISSGAVAGSWKIASGSEAGYRVREKLAFLPAQSDAVGRTSEVSGAATLSQIDGRVTISAASFTVNVSTLKSDRSMRDEKIHEIGLESSRYPTATFTLASPATVALSAIEGHVAKVSVTGTFEIHGTSRTETLPVEMTLSGSTLETVGSLTFPWSEFGMTAPSIGGFVNVTEKATMEFDLRLQRS